MASFTSAGDVTSLVMADRGDTFTVALSGTYLMTIDLQKELGSPGSGAWQTLKRYTTENATVSDKFTTPEYNASYRLLLVVDGGGTCTATITDTGVKEHGTVTIRDTAGNSLLSFNQDGATFAGEVTMKRKDSVSLTATVSITEALHAGKLLVLNAAAGFTATLPAATGTGNVYEFVVGTLITSNAYVLASDSTGLLYGVICGCTTPGTEFTWASDFTDDDDVTLGGTSNATGGSVGDTVVFTDIGTNKWAVKGFITQGGTQATPFS